MKHPVPHEGACAVLCVSVYISPRDCVEGLDFEVNVPVG